MLLGVARELLVRGIVNRDFVRRWVNWKGVPGGARRREGAHARALPRTLVGGLLALHARVRCHGVHDPARHRDAARRRDRARWFSVSSHPWRNTANGNLGGLQRARADSTHVLRLARRVTRVRRWREPFEYADEDRE